MYRLSSIYVLLVFVAVCHGLMFQVQPNQKKCIKEEIHKDVLVTGEYELSEAPEQAANLRVMAYENTFQLS